VPLSISFEITSHYSRACQHMSTGSGAIQNGGLFTESVCCLRRHPVARDHLSDTVEELRGSVRCRLTCRTRMCPERCSSRPAVEHYVVWHASDQSTRLHMAVTRARHWRSAVSAVERPSPLSCQIEGWAGLFWQQLLWRLDKSAYTVILRTSAGRYYVFMSGVGEAWIRASKSRSVLLSVLR
jgi:hypothetical protein